MCFSLKVCRSPLLFSKALESAFNFMSRALGYVLNCFVGIRLTVSRGVMDSYQTRLFQFFYTRYSFLQMPTRKTGEVHSTGRAVPCAAPIFRALHHSNSYSIIRTQLIIQWSFITPPVLFCLLEYHPMLQHPSDFRYKTCGKCSSSQRLEGIFSLMLKSYKLTVPLIFCLRKSADLRNSA